MNWLQMILIYKMKQQSIFYIRETDNPEVVKCGICGDLKQRKCKAQTEYAEPIEYVKLYLIIDTKEGVTLEGIEKIFKEKYQEYNYVSKKFKLNQPKPTEMFKKIVVDKADDFMQSLKNKGDIKYIKFTSEELCLEYVKTHEKSAIELYEANVIDLTFTDDEEDESETESDSEYSDYADENYINLSEYVAEQKKHEKIFIDLTI